MLNGKWKKRFTRWLKLRFAILYPLGVWAVITSYSTDDSIMRSVWFILLGLGIRTWANFYAIKMEKVTTSGPYAHVRHPLYLGSFLILAGFLVMLNVKWILILFFLSVVINIVYNITIRNEERMLLDKFGQEYVEYRRSVPAFFPTIVSYKSGEKWGWSIERYFRSKEYKLIIWMIILAIAFHLKEEFIIEGERFDTKIIFLIAMAFLLGLTDAIVEMFQKKRLFVRCFDKMPLL